MVTPDDVRDLTAQYGEEQFADGKAKQLAVDQPQLDALNAQVAQLQAELAAGKPQPPPPDPTPTTDPPAGYTVLPAGANLQTEVNKLKPIALKGDWKVTASLKIPVGGVDIWLMAGSRLLRAYNDGTGSTRSSMISNADWTRPIQGLKVQGTGKIEALDGMGGNIFGVWADDIYLRGFSCTQFSGGRYFMGGGKRMDVHVGKIRAVGGSGSGAGGWRVATGGGRFWGLDTWSGDDVYQAVPAGNPNDPLWNVPDIDGLTYENCVGKSYTARLMVMGLQDKDSGTSLGMSSGVHNVTFKNVTGYGGGAGVNVANHSSSGSITNVTFVASSIDQSQTLNATQGQPGEVFVSRSAGTGEVNHLDFSGLTVINPRPTKKPYVAQGNVGPDIKQPKVA